MSAILVAFIYLFIAGIIGQIVWATRARRCNATECDRYCTHEPGTILIALFWPLAIPIVIGRLVAWFVMSKDSRAERKAERERVSHEQRLAELKAEKERDDAVMEFLERNGVNARIDEVIK